MFYSIITPLFYVLPWFILVGSSFVSNGVSLVDVTRFVMDQEFPVLTLFNGVGYLCLWGPAGLKSAVFALFPMLVTFVCSGVLPFPLVLVLTRLFFGLIGPASFRLTRFEAANTFIRFIFRALFPSAEVFAPILGALMFSSSILGVPLAFYFLPFVGVLFPFVFIPFFFVSVTGCLAGLATVMNWYIFGSASLHGYTWRTLWSTLCMLYRAVMGLVRLTTYTWVATEFVFTHIFVIFVRVISLPCILFGERAGWGRYPLSRMAWFLSAFISALLPSFAYLALPLIILFLLQLAGGLFVILVNGFNLWELVFTFLNSLLLPFRSYLMGDVTKRVILRLYYVVMRAGEEHVFRSHVQGRPLRPITNDSINRMDAVDLNAQYMRVARLIPSFFLWQYFIMIIILYIMSNIVTYFVMLCKNVLNLPLRILDAFIGASIFLIIPDVFFYVEELALSFLWAYLKGALTSSFIIDVSRLIGLSVFIGVSFDDGDEPIPAAGPTDKMRPKLHTVYIRKWLTLTRRTVLRTITRLDNVRLPEIIQAAYRPPTLDSIRASYAFLADAGLTNVQAEMVDTDSISEEYLAAWGSYKRWLLGVSSLRLGYGFNIVSPRSWLPADFFPEIEPNVWSTTFTSWAREIKSFSRYYSGVDKIKIDRAIFLDAVDGAWPGIAEQYRNSQLTTVEELFRKWKKNFNMGFLFLKQNLRTGRWRQVKRQEVIDAVGGKWPFIKIWEKVFKNAQTLITPGPVFTKAESLSMKKYLSGTVRTIFGVAFDQYVLTAPVVFGPDHNVKPFGGCSKVGMPITGVNFDKIWRLMTTREEVWAGDMTAFDSSINPCVMRIVAELRKKGFREDLPHKDYDRICQILDIATDNLISHPAGFKSSGEIAFKAQAPTTGHASTTPTNNMALIVGYVIAWRMVTGMRARTFFDHNTLVNYGDDHLLAFDRVFGWHPSKAASKMLEIGMVMRDEAPEQNRIPTVDTPLPKDMKSWRDANLAFLKKKPLPLTPDIIQEMNVAGVKANITWATCHDPIALIKKIKANVPSRSESDYADPTASYSALLSYMAMCAHHHDIYIKLARRSISMYNKVKHYNSEHGKSKVKVPRPPTYNEVLIRWYDGTPLPNIDGEEYEADDMFTVTAGPDHFGSFVRWISDFPTMLSPRYKNTRWADWLQLQLSESISWPITLIGKANGIARDIATTRMMVQRTPYSFLRAETLVPGHETMGQLLPRHWLFMVYQRLVNNRKWFTPLDLVRSLDAFVITCQFMVTGRMVQSVVELDLHLMDTVVVYALSHLTLDLGFDGVFKFVPSPSELVGFLMTYIMSVLAPSGSIDLQPLTAAMRRMLVQGQGKLLFSAPTGVGKTTKMMLHLSSMTNRRLVVIVPRRAVAINVGEYMKDTFPEAGITIATEGYQPNPTFKICYTTPQMFSANPMLNQPDNVVVLDEAHIDEPIYIVLRRYLLDTPNLVFFVTATPPDDLRGVMHIEVPSVPSFKVVERVRQTDDLTSYVHEVAQIANGRPWGEKMLVFVPTKKKGEELAQKLRRSYCFLNSDVPRADPNVDIIISTNVADAGLTIPDAVYVITSDCDIRVNLGVDETESKARYGHLSRNTRTQRKGRTGRTCDGYFLFYELAAFQRDELVWNIFDYLMGCAGSVRKYLQYIPLNAQVTELQRKYLALLDDQRVGVANIAFYDELCAELEGQGTDPKTWINAFVSFTEEKLKTGELPVPFKDIMGTELTREKQKKVSEMMEEMKEQEEVIGIGKILPKMGKPKDVTRVAAWQEVSGSGNLCGARAIQGLVWTHRHIKVPLDDILEYIRFMSGEEVWKAQDENFSLDQIYNTMAGVWGLKPLVYMNGEVYTSPMLVEAPAHGPPSQLLLDTEGDFGHYTYYGYPYPDK